MGRRAVETLKQGKEVEYGLLGISSDPDQTNRVSAVDRQSPAARGHLQVNDEILAVERHAGRRLRLADPGDQRLRPPATPVRLKIRRPTR